MATTSRFLQLSSSILLEYIYADQSNLNDYRISTLNRPIYRYSGFLKNDNNNYFLIRGTKDYKQDNCYLKDTINKIKRMRNLIDPDDLLDLPDDSPVYDTIKIHLIQGFNYESHLGFDLKMSIDTNYNKEFSLLQFVTYTGDSYWKMNPTPFMMGGKQYTSFIELKILASYNLLYDYYFGDKSLVESLTYNGSFSEGLKQNQLIKCKFSWIDRREIVNNIEYAYEAESILFDINTLDDYNTLGACIKESDSFDYIEYYATQNGSIQYLDDFINSLNNNGHDYVILHTLVVSEFINIAGSDPYWVVTNNLDISQVGNFATPNLYRPVIKNENAIAYKIDYVVRLFDRIDNSQIWKTGSMMSLDVYKYGKSLNSIKLDENPVQNIIYNKNVIKQIVVSGNKETPLITTRNVLGLVSNNNIVLNAQNLVSLNNNILTNNSIFDVNNTYANGVAKIVINNTTSYIKFIISEYKNNTISNVDLSNLGTAYLFFKKDNGGSISIVEYKDSNLNINKTNGEILFRISETDANKILNLSNREFSIVFQSDDIYNQIKSEKNTKCYGIFYSQKEWSSLLETETNEKYKQSLLVANNKINQLYSLNNELDTKISTLTKENNNILSSYKKDPSDSSDIITRLQNQIKTTTDLLFEKDDKIKKLTEEISLFNLRTDIIKKDSTTEIKNTSVKDSTNRYKNSQKITEDSEKYRTGLEDNIRDKIAMT